MTKYYVLFFLMVLTIPLFLGVNAWQSNECGIIRNEIKKLERSQENAVGENKMAATEIVDLLATGRLDIEARKMGLEKKQPEDVILIVMGRKESGR
jgi:cell division protein FtsL